MLKDDVIENIYLIKYFMENGKLKTFPLIYFDFESEKNLNKKNKILTKLKNDEQLTESELTDKEVFELLPDIQNLK